MRPAFRLSINGLDATTQVRDRLVSITVVDEAGQQSDTCEVAIDDRDASIPVPPEGAAVVVELGYEGAPLVSVGSFVIDEVEFGNGPRSMVIKASSTSSAEASAGGMAAIAWEGAAAVRGLLGYIYQREGGYESFNRGTAGDSAGPFPGRLTEQTIGQVIALQRSGRVFAVGAAQFVPGTLEQAMRDAGLKTGDRFSAANQDRMATALLLGSKRPALRDYLTGRSSNITAAHQALCQEWAGVVCPSGVGFYDGRNGNRARGTVDEVQDRLRQARANLANQRQAREEAAQAQPPGSPAISPGQRTLLKQRRTQSWHDTTLGRIVTTVAARHKLTPVIRSAAAEERIRHEDQTNESDQAFLTRLATRFGVVIKPKDGQLVLADRDRGTFAASTAATLRNDGQTQWRARLKDRAQYSAVKARWIDRKTSTERVVEHRQGQGFPTLELPKTYRSEKEAERAAESKAAALAAASVEVSIQRPGMPQLAAEGTITLQGFRREIDGVPWVINRVQHRLDRSGFQTSIECGTPRENRGPGGASGGGGGPSGLFPGGPTASGTYVQGNIGPTSSGDHFDIKRADGAFFDRGSLDRFVTVEGQPLSSGVTVPGGRFGARRGYGSHRGWDFAFRRGARLRLQNGAQWVGNTPGTAKGDRASFRTPDGTVYVILHGRFQP
ncbi:contractile injection system protein, VgrG/Pvc8 family [Cyanobium sp. N5-Cardenillas]|uniref:contractile injection system protein, VgrG/Pvc8 family n=1 Tax=Cyanobium sp. N5-Cardenillas TaxID=2823720 RepID=UPI0020CFCA36|nr:contractile injection system protein, VgrG/Pvc8 family [Cyanobium sp. N5-Cardenillas]MCP9785394.1 hypothetical protein [Cyanobium sp. N5-Cardenillas]